LYREPGQEGKSGEAGFKVSRFQGFKVSRFQGFKVSRFQGFKVSRFQGFRGFKDPEVSRLKVEMPGSYFETLKL
jgi:hypothetical protein